MAQLPSAVRLSSVIALIAALACPLGAASSKAQAQPQPRPRSASASPDGQPTSPAVAPGDAVNDKKLDAALRAWARGSSAASRRVIVTATPGSDDLVANLIPAMGGLLKKRLPGIDALVADLPRGVLRQLTLDTHVVSISADTAVLAIDGNLIASNAATAPAAPLREVMGLSPSKPAGAGIGIAIVDSGIAPSEDFVGRIAAFHDFTQGGIATAPVDPYGHGTHIAGIIGSSGVAGGDTSEDSGGNGGGGSSSNDAQYRGLGAEARLIGLRVLDENGAGETSQVIQAIEFAIAQRDALGIDVINLSLGHPIYEPAASDPLVRAVERAVDAGIVVVASAGNFGYNAELGRSGYAGITSPGNAPSVITVGAMRGADTAMRGDDDVAPYSSRGPSWYDGFAKPDLLAPGHGIVSNGPAASTLYADYPSVRAGSSLMRLNGTSMATAVTTGVVALMLEAHRQSQPQTQTQPREALAPNAIKAILQYTSTPLDARAGSPDALTQGAGAINAPAAIAAARAIDASTALGDDWLDGALPPFTIYAGEAWSWNASITWRDTPISGDTLLEVHRSAWTSSVDWGQPIAWDADVLPQPSVVWSPAIDWASNVVWGLDLVGTTTNDQTFTWGYVEDPSRTVWADLATRPTDGQTFCWGYIDTSSTAKTPGPR
jgi:serine protease AprX